MTNAVTGSTDGGSLALTQNAAGGAGGGSYLAIAGAGGEATSNLTFDDTKNTAQSASVIGQAEADGGVGGEKDRGYGASGTGGNATASSVLTGASSVEANAIADGGGGGLVIDSPNAAAGAGGTASATSSALGVGQVSANASANGGAGGSVVAGNGTGGAGGSASAASTASGDLSAIANATANGGAGGQSQAGLPAGTTGSATATATAHNGAGALASATALADGASGAFTASAASTPATSQLIETVLATASGVVAGSSIGQAQAVVGGAAPAFATTQQGVAFATAAPNAASTSAVLAANANIATAFGASPSFFAIGELGGGYSSYGQPAPASETTTSSIVETVDLTKLASRQQLVAGFYDGDVVGAGVTGVTFDLYADGADLIHQTFATAAAALTWFTDNAVDLGSLAAGQPLGGNTLTLQAVLTVTSTSAGSGFYGDLIIGDPPTQSASPSHQKFIEAMSGFGATGGGAAVAADTRHNRVAPMLVAPHTYLA